MPSRRKYENADEFRIRCATYNRERRKRIGDTVRAYDREYGNRLEVKPKKLKRALDRYYDDRERFIKDSQERRDRIALRLDEIHAEENRLIQLRDGFDTEEKRTRQKIEADLWRDKQDPVRLLVQGALRRQHGGSVKLGDPRIDKLVSDLQPVPTHCPIFNVELIYKRGSGLNHPNCASIDKIIPERGYEVGNIAIISRRANSIKHDGTADEHDAIAHWIRERGG